MGKQWVNNLQIDKTVVDKAGDDGRLKSLPCCKIFR